MIHDRCPYVRIVANLVFLPAYYGLFWLVTHGDPLFWRLFRIAFWVTVALWWAAAVLNLWADYLQEFLKR